MIEELVLRNGIWDVIHGAVESFTSVVLLVMIGTMCYSVHQDRKNTLSGRVRVPYTVELIVFFAILLVANEADITMLLFRRNPDAVTAHRIAAFIYVLALWGETFFVLNTLRVRFTKVQENRFVAVIFKALMVLQFVDLLLLFCTPFTDVLYRIDTDGVFSMSWGFWIWTGISLFTYLFIGVILFIMRKQADPSLLKLGSLSAFCPMLSIGIRIFLPDLNVTNFVVCVAAMFMFVVYENYKAEIIAEDARRMERMQTKLMVSQIQPHFLHNTLVSLIYHCDKDARKTKQGLVDFSKYLRHNLDSIKSESVIPFESELEHTRVYLSLEKLRFEDRLQVESDIRDWDFKLPIFSVQTLVENAVKHGVSKNGKKGGTVRVSSRATDTCHEVEIHDDGVGFDITQLEKLDDTHIGIANVRARHAAECNGELLVDSVQGEGTTCIIRIPKEGTTRSIRIPKEVRK